MDFNLKNKLTRNRMAAASGAHMDAADSTYTREEKSIIAAVEWILNPKTRATGRYITADR